MDWPSLWIVSLFPQPSLSLSNRSANKVNVVTEVEVIHGLENIDFHLQSPICLQLLLLPDLPTAANNTEPQI